MKKVFIAGLIVVFIFSALITLIGFAAETSKTYYKNGQLESEMSIENGPDGWAKRYYENGQLQAETVVENSGNDVSAKSYYQNGQLAHEEFIQGRTTGGNGWVKDYYENGKLKADSVLKNGKSERKFYDEGGNPKTDALRNNKSSTLNDMEQLENEEQEAIKNFYLGSGNFPFKSLRITVSEAMAKLRATGSKDVLLLRKKEEEKIVLQFDLSPDENVSCLMNCKHKKCTIELGWLYMKPTGEIIPLPVKNLLVALNESLNRPIARKS